MPARELSALPGDCKPCRDRRLSNYSAFETGTIDLLTQRIVAGCTIRSGVGGFNHSGYGREAGVDSITDYTRTQTTWVNLSDASMADPFVMR